MLSPYHRLVRSDAAKTAASELAKVDALAAQLTRHIDEQSAAIDLVHIHRAQSRAVQNIVAQLLMTQLGFGQEVVIPKGFGFSTQARPDFYFGLGGDRGIIAEVERGGTTTNNHDLKDVWKAHISPNAHHLFLVVPNANWNEAGLARERPFARVVARLATFFGDPRRELDILSVHVFGYGRPA